MLWDHLDGNRWIIPDTKNDFPHTLVLPELAMSQLPERSGEAVWKSRDGDWPVGFRVLHSGLRGDNWPVGFRVSH